MNKDCCEKCIEWIKGEHTPCECHLLGGAVPTQPENSWEKFFDEGRPDIFWMPDKLRIEQESSTKFFGYKWFDGKQIHEVTDWGHIKSFIHKEIEAAEKRAVREHDAKWHPIVGNSMQNLHEYKQGRRDVLEELEGKLPSKQLPDDGNGDEDSYNFGFNYFRTTVLKLIKSIKGE